MLSWLRPRFSTHVLFEQPSKTLHEHKRDTQAGSTDFSDNKAPGMSPSPARAPGPVPTSLGEPQAPQQQPAPSVLSGLAPPPPPLAVPTSEQPFAQRTRTLVAPLPRPCPGVARAPLRRPRPGVTRAQAAHRGLSFCGECSWAFTGEEKLFDLNSECTEGISRGKSRQ
jgi:hypothetical protein